MAVLMDIPGLGRCDGKCYGAVGPIEACRCVCGGSNHGVGLRKAVDALPRLEAADAAGLAAWWRLSGHPGRPPQAIVVRDHLERSAVVAARAEQIDLFDEEAKHD